MKTFFSFFVLLLTSAATFAQTPADEKAIKTVIAGESAAYYQRNADKVLSYWADVPYATHSYTDKGKRLPAGVRYDQQSHPKIH